jgi:hypothetical protein
VQVAEDMHGFIVANAKEECRIVSELVESGTMVEEGALFYNRSVEVSGCRMGGMTDVHLRE